MAKKSAVDVIALILVIVGAINWGLVGLFGFNLVESILGTGMLTTIVYDLVGLAGLWTIYLASKK
jgi:uncharacterized membrane protein YuzA (DUF378 family)